MATERLDLRDVPPSDRHPMIHTAFEQLESGEALEIVNDHEPKPLFYEFAAEVDAFDADGYNCEQQEPGKYVARLPKQ